jgi:hypothetical protein
MSLTVSKVNFTHKSDRAVYITSALARQLRLRGRKKVDVQLGGRSVSVLMKPLPQKGKQLWLPYALRDIIHAPKAAHVYVTASDQGNRLRLGPLVGVLTSGGGATARPFGSRTGFIREILRAGQGKAYVFAFTPRDVHWEQNTVLGYFAEPSGGWSRKTVPLPDVVYNRLASRSFDVSAGMEQLKSRFLKKNIPVFNWSFYNKWDVYRMLENEKDAYRHIPDSTLNPTPERFKDMVSRHRFLYLKPTGGSLGKGIYRVTYAPGKGYAVQFRRNGRNALIRHAKFADLLQRLGAGHGRLRNYVVQKGIRLISMDGSPLDFRFHLVRDGANRWVVAGIGAKKAGKGSVTTHIRNGGTLMTPEQALWHVFGDRGGDLLQRMKEVSIKLAEAIQRNSRHHVGELGFDLGIDTSEDIWMFEANSKPGRSIFKHPLLKNEGKQALALLYNHCLYLAKFRKRGNA